MDGSTDASVTKKEAIFVVVFNPISPSFELALKDSLGKTAFSEVDELILQMYYLYEKSPKKLQQLKELVNVCEEIYEFKTNQNFYLQCLFKNNFICIIT